MKVVITDDNGLVIFEADRDSYVAPTSFEERSNAFLAMMDCIALLSGMFVLAHPFGLAAEPAAPEKPAATVTHLHVVKNDPSEN